MKPRTLIAASLVLALSTALALAQYGGGKNNKPKQPADTRSLEGKKAPDFALTTIDGQDVKLSEQKGNVVGAMTADGLLAEPVERTTR